MRAETRYSIQKLLVGEGAKAIRTFDRVLANWPFSLKSWGYETWSNGHLAFVQHMVSSLKEDGMLGVVLPHGVLFRGGVERHIREGMLKDDLVEAVIGLASNLSMAQARRLKPRPKKQFQSKKKAPADGSAGASCIAQE